MKELKALERIKNAPTIYVGLASDIYTRYPYECKEIEKALKTLEIIKMKNVDIPMVKTCNSVNDYNEWHSLYKEMHLTQKEYDLLKEILQ